MARLRLDPAYEAVRQTLPLYTPPRAPDVWSTVFPPAVDGVRLETAAAVMSAAAKLKKLRRLPGRRPAAPRLTVTADGAGAGATGDMESSRSPSP